MMPLLLQAIIAYFLAHDNHDLQMLSSTKF
jgi:hypothetical protein